MTTFNLEDLTTEQDAALFGPAAASAWRALQAAKARDPLLVEYQQAKAALEPLKAAYEGAKAQYVKAGAALSPAKTAYEAAKARYVAAVAALSKR